MTKDGYNHALYELHIYRDKPLRDTFLEAVVDRTMREFFLPNRNPGQRCLYLCITTRMLFCLERYFKYRYPNLKVCLFFGDDPDDKITPDVDIILSTIKKSGTGRDISKLKVAVNTVSFKSSPLIKQVFGRLREIPGEETIFVDYYCRELEHHVMHARVRKEKYLSIATRVDHQQ